MYIVCTKNKNKVVSQNDHLFFYKCPMTAPHFSITTGNLSHSFSSSKQVLRACSPFGCHLLTY